MAAHTHEGISIEEKFAPVEKQPIKQTKRPEMKGPDNISNILSGLKTKSVNVPVENKTEGSTISIQDLKELTNQKMPKSNRKQKASSAKNTISLDL